MNGPTRRLRRLAARAAPPVVHRLWEERVGRESVNALARIADGPRPIVAGPWLSEVGFELLYWIPFLQWFVERFEIAPAEVVAVSRGGVESWYGNVASRYVELFDLVEPAELRRRRDARLEDASSEKQGRVAAGDEELLEQVRARRGLAESGWLHPSLMYRLFNVVWAWGGDLDLVLTHTRFRRLTAPAAPAGLPPRYVAVKAYASTCFPETQANRDFVDALLGELAREHPIVLLRTGLVLDDHPELGRGNVLDASHLLADVRTNLGVQTAIVGAAEAVVTTYGGFAYLGPLLGVPTRSFYSDGTFNALHGEVLAHAARALAAPGDLRPRHVSAWPTPAAA